MRAHHLFPGTTGYREILDLVGAGQGSGDTDAARQILVDAGYTVADGELRSPDGVAVPEFRLRFAGGDTAQEEVAELIGDQLRRLGVRVSVTGSDDLAATVGTGDFDLVLREEQDGSRVGPTIERWRAGSAANSTGWQDAGAEALLDRAAVELDDARLRGLLNRHDELLTAAAVVLPLYQRPHLLALVGGFVNLRANAAGGLFTYNAQEWGVLA
jgi:peptide/nickel transport system substrate-binding protein